MEDLEKSRRTSERKRLDLSFTQVAASALAAVVGALLASQLGVYGTILGAAVVSAGATTGGALFQHLFRRTGEQLREISGGSVPLEQTRRVGSVGGTEEPGEAVAPAESGEKTQVFDPFDPGGEHTRMMAQISPPDPAETVAVYRGRTTWKPRSWRVYAITATLVFVIALGAVGMMELAVGKPADQFFGSGSGSGGGGPKPGSGVSAPADPSGSSGSTSTSTGGSGSGSGGQGQSQGQGQGNGSGHGAASPGASASSSPKPDPSPSSGASGASSPSPGASSSAGAGSGTGGSAVSGNGVAQSTAPSP